MIISYINKDGNKDMQDFLKVPENFIKIDNIYFEQAEEDTKPTKEVKEVTAEKQDLGVDYIEEKAREYLKEHKVKWFGLLKGSKIVDKAIANGFII